MTLRSAAPEPYATALLRGLDPLDADSIGALARMASDVQELERAIDNRFPADPVVSAYNRALHADPAGGPRSGWTEFYLALARFMNVASLIAPVPPSANARAAFGRLQLILEDDLAETILPTAERRRLMRRLRKITDPVAVA